MYTGKTEQPCCLCDDADTVARLDLPPRAIQLMANGDPIAWRDVVGEVSIHFCEDDWALVRDLVLDVGMSPLPRCNVARASFDLRDDFEAFLPGSYEEPDRNATEARLREAADEVVASYDDPGEPYETRDLVEASVVRWALEDLGATPD